MEGRREEILRPPLVEEAPWLVYTHGHSKHKQIQTFWNMFSSPSDRKKLFTKSIIALRGKSICATCHGWLILRDKNLFSLWNPVNLQNLLLPPLPTDEENLLTCLLTSPPDSDGCVLFLFFQYQVFSCHPRVNSTCSWVTQKIELDGENAEISLAVVTDENRIMYGMAGIRDPTDNGVRHYMVRMEVTDDGSNTLTLESLQLREPDCNYVGIHSRGYLVESCGHIYYVGIFRRHAWGNRISEVKVWELQLLGKNNNNNNKWAEIKCLDGRAFFVGNDCCTWCWGSNTTESSSGGRCIQGNCVYFLVPSDVDILYSYSLDENKLTVHWRCLDLPAPFNLPVWVNVVPQPYNLLDMQECMTRQIKKKFDGHNLDHGSISNNTSNTELREGPLENETQEDSRFTNLPTEMVQLVSEHMHIFDYWNFRASCKTFQSAVSPIYKWRAKNYFPLFIFFMNDYGLCEVMDPCREDSHSKILKLSLDPFIVDFSKDGWLVLLNFAADSMEFCNPMTRIRGAFPPINRMCDIRSIGFSTYPTSPDCVTVAFAYDFDAVIIYYLQHGNETWTMCEFYPENDIEFSVGTSSPVYFAGAFYVLDREDGYLGSFELVDGEGSWKVYDKPLFRFGTIFHSCHLVECGEQLLAVFIGYMGTWIQVLKFNHLKKEWTEIESLGNHSLFISHTSSFSKVVNTKEGMENRIYISRLKGNRIIFYSLETGKYHVDVSTSENALENFNDTTEPLYSCWI